MNLTNKILVYSISILTFSIIMPYISNSTLKEVQKSFQEVAYSYYMREKNIQYHPAKDCLFPLEEATEQNINYLVCTSFTMAVYLELLNVSSFSGVFKILKNISESAFNIIEARVIKIVHNTKVLFWQSLIKSFIKLLINSSD